MHPILFQFPHAIPLIGGKAIHFYGAMMALGFLMALIWIRTDAKRLNYFPKKLDDLFFYMLVSGVVGSRLGYFLFEVPGWWKNPLVFFRLWEGGLVFYGGLITATLVAVWFCKKHKLSFFKVADIFVPALALGHAFGRLGCFFAGCCYGQHSHSWFSIIFPQTPYGIAPAGVPLYPTQLTESAFLLVLFGILAWFRKRKKFDGEVFLLYATGYAILRFSIEFIRGDLERGFPLGGPFSTSQWISLAWIAAVLLIWFKILRKPLGKVADK